MSVVPQPAEPPVSYKTPERAETLEKRITAADTVAAVSIGAEIGGMFIPGANLVTTPAAAAVGLASGFYGAYARREKSRLLEAQHDINAAGGKASSLEDLSAKDVARYANTLAAGAELYNEDRALYQQDAEKGITSEKTLTGAAYKGFAETFTLAVAAVKEKTTKSPEDKRILQQAAKALEKADKKYRISNECREIGQKSPEKTSQENSPGWNQSPASGLSR